MADEGNDVASTATKRQHLTSSTGTLISASPSSSSITPGDSLPLPTLPFEIVVEILSRLPVKLLIQLQCVCKSWKSLISDPKFAKKHLRVSTKRHHLFTNASFEHILNVYSLSSVFTEITATATAVQLQFPLNDQNWDLIIGSCHGILCFSLVKAPPLLWNPSIRKFTKLPFLKIPKREGCYKSYGFGYDHVSDTYKVVAVYWYSNDSSYNRVYKNQVKVHTLGTNSWRRIRNFPYAPLDGSGKFVCGTVNWLASKDSYTSLVIVSLDLEKESYREFLQPVDRGVAVVTLKLGVLRNCLCAFSNGYAFTDVWLMREYGNKDSWTKLFHVPLMGDLGSWSYASPLYVSEDDQVLLDIQFNLVVYNSRNGTFKDLGIHNIYSWMISEVYHESLISPCS